ncbi:MAG: VWA domain-containing protein [Bacteroidetes bacterium]|nr:MAG: VWA domain-containing protein [Bacteroidota bacterium]REK08168.1 MAG: VWA domain-containing protein [Bacteroidota bacterium]REK32373.1 MAG: VWA domain-containing protein [Bacteroidota bacterium]REK49607.1 MAG: VWA domain-containing protein [Bacteroidota bacterium]
MFRFAHQEHLYALLAIPVMLIFYIIYYRWKKRVTGKIGDEKLIDRLTDSSSRNKPVIKMLLFILAYAFLVIGWANPQIGTKLEEVKREGVDVIIALDISNSMKAEDIRPNRLERAKQSISRLIDKLENDRIGIIVFAGHAYVQLPITSDYGAAKLFLSSVDSDIIPTQGTAIGAAIELSLKSFVGEDNKHKALIIITDGENHEDDAVSAAAEAASQGVVIHTIGFGSPAGAPIPVYRNGIQVDFLKDKNGSTVLSKLDEVTLQRIANEGKGQYIRATNTDDGLNKVLSQIASMEKKTFGMKQYTGYEDRFQYFIGAALLLLFMESLTGSRRSRMIEKLKLFGTPEKMK